jgi:hypothetical protein
MTMNAYLNKFTQMSRYARDEVSTDEKKQDAFLNGLNDEIQFHLLNTDYEDFQKMVDKAIIVENKFKDIEKNGKRKTSFSGQSMGSNTRPRLPQSGPFFKNPSTVHPSMHGQRPPFQMQRPNFQSQHLNFQMQKPQPQAHRPSVQQPSRQNVQQGPHPTTPTSPNAPAQGSHNGGACFKCGLTGHFAWQCPPRQAVPGARNQNKGSRISCMAR